MDDRFDHQFVYAAVTEVIDVTRIFYRTLEICDVGFDNTNVYVVMKNSKPRKMTEEEIKVRLTEEFEGSDYFINENEIEFIKDGNKTVGFRFIVKTASEFDPNPSEDIDFNQEVFLEAIISDLNTSLQS